MTNAESTSVDILAYVLLLDRNVLVLSTIKDRHCSKVKTDRFPVLV